MLGRGVRGVWGSCLRPPRPGVLAPDVDTKGLPLTEPLPYMKKEKQMKTKITLNNTAYRQYRHCHEGIQEGCQANGGEAGRRNTPIKPTVREENKEEQLEERAADVGMIRVTAAREAGMGWG